MSSLHVSSIVGLPQVDGWSHVVESTTSLSHLIVAYAVAGHQARVLGKQFGTHIENISIVSSEELYSFVSSSLAEIESQGCTLDIACMLLLDARITLAGVRGSVLLRRQSKSGIALSAHHDLKLIEGTHKLGDIYILSTQQSAHFFPEIEQKLTRGFDVESTIDSLIPAVQSQPYSSVSAVAFVQVVQASAQSHRGVFSPVQPTVKPRGLETHVEKHSTTNTVTQNIPVVQQVEGASSDDENLYVTDETAETQDEHSTPSFLSQLLSHSRSILGVLLASGQKVVFLMSAKNRAVLDTVRARFSGDKSNLSADISASAGLEQEPSSYEVKHYPPIKSNTGFWIRIIILCVGIGVSIAIGFWVWSRYIQFQVEAIRQELQPAILNIEQAYTNSSQDPILARSEVVKGIQELEKIQEKFAENAIAQTEIKKELALARTILETISGRDEFAQLSVYYNLRLVVSDFVTSYASSLGKTAVFVDRQAQRAIILDLEQKQTTQFSLQSVGDILAITLQDETLIVLSTDGVFGVSLASPETPVQLIGAGDQTQGGKFIQTFASFLYVFNPQTRSLYRYTQSGSTYSASPTRWLQDPLGVPYDQVISVVVDGNMWIGTKDGQIKKFAAGVAQDFSPTNIPEPLTSMTQLVTSDVLQHLYILDSANNRIVILTKEGLFLREIKSVPVGGISTMVVNEEMGMIFALSGSTVYDIPL